MQSVKDIDTFKKQVCCDFEYFENQGIISKESKAFFISSALAPHKDCINNIGEYFIDQETIRTKYLHVAYPDDYGELYRRHNISTVIVSPRVDELNKNINVVLSILKSYELDLSKVHILISQKLLNSSIGSYISALDCPLIQVERGKLFLVEDLLKGEYIKFLYEYGNGIVSLADLTVAQNQHSSLYFSDTYFELATMQYIAEGLPNKYALEPYTMIANNMSVANRESNFVYQLIELECAILACLKHGIQFSARGRGYLMKEMVKVYAYLAEEEFDERFWKKYIDAIIPETAGTILKKIESIYSSAKEEFSEAQKYLNLKSDYECGASYQPPKQVTKYVQDLMQKKNFPEAERLVGFSKLLVTGISISSSTEISRIAQEIIDEKNEKKTRKRGIE